MYVLLLSSPTAHPGARRPEVAETYENLLGDDDSSHDVMILPIM